MDKLIIMLEDIISDIAFRGTNEIRSDVLSRIDTAQKLCNELDMETGDRLCEKLKECAAEGSPDETSAVLCSLCCYMECISG